MRHSISIWFFIGLLLTLYGVLILAAGIHQFVVGASTAVALPQLHIGIWWGAGMLPLGLGLMIKDRPWRGKNATEHRHDR